MQICCNSNNSLKVSAAVVFEKYLFNFTHSMKLYSTKNGLQIVKNSVNFKDGQYIVSL